jgi:hypothetical protein
MTDATQLAGLLQFLSDWLTAAPSPLGVSLAQFAGSSAYDTRALRQDLARFVFLLGSSDGEPLFQPVHESARLP